MDTFDAIYNLWRTYKHNTPVERWEKMGFLDGIEDDVLKEKLAYESDRMLFFIQFSRCNGRNFGNSVCALVFPTLRRIMTDGELISSYNPELMCNEAEHEYRFISLKASETPFMVDVEATVAGVLEEKFKKYKFKNRGE